MAKGSIPGGTLTTKVDSALLAGVQRRVKAEGTSVNAWLAQAARAALEAPSDGGPTAAKLTLPKPAEYLHAGRLAGLLEGAFRASGALALHDDDAQRAWVAAHPAGASLVAELMSAAGLASDFRRWRGAL